MTKISTNSTKSEINTIFELQRAEAVRLRNTTIRERKNHLKQLKRWILEHRTDIHNAVYEDMRKSPQEADLSEVYPVLTEIRHTLSHLDEWSAKKPASGSLTYLGTRGYVLPEPRGVCLIISPWNYPFNLSAGPLVSALAAGNTVVLKPSEYVPATNKVLIEMVEELFLPELVSVIEGESDVAAELLSKPFDHIFFTGSPAVGKIVMESAARNLSSVTLELGGKSPTIVDESADIQDAAHKIAWGKWLNAGQTCVAPDYLLVHEKVKDPFLSELKKRVDQLYGKGKNYTSIISDRHFDRLNELLKEVQNSECILYAGGKSNREERRIAPTIIVDPGRDLRIMQEEIFGPILPVFTYQNLSEAIDEINNRPKPLSMYVFSTQRKVRKRMERETSSGTLVFNDCVLQFAHPDLPFGGINYSGFGKAHGKSGFSAFSNEKSVLKQRTGFTMAKTVYPPYSKLKNRIIEWMVRYF